MYSKKILFPHENHKVVCFSKFIIIIVQYNYDIKRKVTEVICRVCIFPEFLFALVFLL